MFKAKLLTSFLCLVTLTGCSNIELKIEPQVEAANDNSSNVKFVSKIVYEGNREYLPQILVDDVSSQYTSYYEYNVKYINGSTKYDGLNLWNPLVMVGFPLSSEAVIVDGKLILKNEANEENTFTATCVANKTRNMFQNGGSTEPRKKCLLAIKENINNQVIQFIQGGINANK